MRLNKYLARAGVASRRRAEELIAAGRVRVGGGVVTDPWFRVGGEQLVEVDGESVGLPEEFVYILLHKPLNTVSTLSDEQGRATVRELIDIPERIFPVGRLDYRTSGVLLLTNDGEITNLLLHPRRHVRKVYEVTTHKRILEGHLKRLQKGVLLPGDGVTAPCGISLVRLDKGRPVYRMVLFEGRNRQIRRMLSLFSYHVKKLVRLEFAGLTTRGLLPGQWRFLSKKEIEALKKRIGYHGNQES